jgi:hypothetical protein
MRFALLLISLSIQLCLLLASAHAVVLSAAEVRNHAGRRLGPVPVLVAPVAFNTPQADAVLANMQIMPVDSPWNEDITRLPVHPDSERIMQRIRDDFGKRRTLRVFPEMNFVLVPDQQPLVPIRFVDYPDESDFFGGSSPIATWPIPPALPVEGWPASRPAREPLATWQRDPGGVGGDRHAIIVQPGRRRIFETWQTRLTDAQPAWQASNGAIFPLDSNVLRPAGKTSGDAAGLPMFPALIRYDECERGVIEHALRIIVKRSRREYIYPATHFASPISAKDRDFASYPAMGQRVRLKASVAIPARWSKQSRAVAQALKTYGALVADNGGFFSVSATPDERFPEGCFREVETLGIDQFEVIVTTGPTEGPRAGSPAPKAHGPIR